MAFDRGHALLIGVGSYQHIPDARIPISVEDAREVGKALHDPDLCGYPREQVTFLHDEQASRDGILKALADLAARTAPEDTVLLFYSGHGALGTDSSYYLTTFDSQVSGGRVVKGSGVSDGELLAALRAIPARRMILFFNACYSGELSPHLGLGDEAQAFAVSSLPNSAADAILSSGEGRIIITACREEQKSWIGNGKISLFAQALVDGMKGKGWVRNNAGYIGAFGLYEYLYETVKESAKEIGQVQEPVLNVLQGVGPFPLALYRGASEPSSFSLEKEALPAETPVRQVSPKASQRAFDRRVINTGGGAYIEGNVHIGKGDFVGRDQIKVNVQGGISGGIMAVGNGNIIGAPQAPGSAAELIQLMREIRSRLPQAGLDVDTREMVEADIQAVEAQLAKPEPKKALVLPKLKSIAEVLGSAVAAGETLHKLAPMVQQALTWAQQLLK